jgi:hypothetical protein
MKSPFIAGVVLICGVTITFSVGAKSAAAQGPAGSGAAEAAQDSARGAQSLNPMKWMKKDSKSSETPESRADAEKKLTPGLQAQGLLAANATATEACAPFVALDGCLASLHASHRLGVNFNCLRAVVTGVNTTADVSECKLADGDKAETLQKAIHLLKSDANAKQAVKEAELQAKNDLSEISLVSPDAK